MQNSSPPEMSESSQANSLLDDVFVSLDPRTYIPANVSTDVAAANTRAFLDMIAHAEGTAGHGDDGYNIMVGYATFDSYLDHPRQLQSFRYKNGTTGKSSAAGRYQFLAATWDDLRAKLGLSDFSPASQDRGAVELIRQKGALADVQAGRAAAAIAKVRTVWASFPAAGYGQGERSLSSLLAAYSAAGGTITEA